VGAAATLSLLQSLGLEAEMLEAGCCGMAGTFGYEAEHYELSMKVGEKLLNSEFKIQNSEVVCSGAACRMQVTQGAGVEAKHPLEVVWEVIGKWSHGDASR
jgi:Fe-S oxidoreductase